MALHHRVRRNLCTKGSAVHDQRCHLRQGVVFLASLCVLLTAVTHGLAADILASNKQPLSFGPGQTIIDLKRIVWEPLKGEGIPPGAKIATLRGDLAKGGGELLVYLPPNYTFPNHSYTLTVCLDATSFAAGSYGCDDGRIAPTRFAVIGAGRGDRSRRC